MTQFALSVPTTADKVVEGDETFTIAFGDLPDWMAPGRQTAVTVTVVEDEGEAFTVTAEPAEIGEGEFATLTVSIDNGVTFADARTIELAVTGEVSASDYALEAQTLEFAAGEASAATTLTAVPDDESEEPETATVTARLGGEAVGTATLTLADAQPVPVPLLSGVAQVGRTLEATFEAPPPPRLAYEWLRDGGTIAGAAGVSYTPTDADIGALLTVRVSQGARAADSSALGPVWPAPGNPPLESDEEELLGTLLTVGSTDAHELSLAGYGVLQDARFGSVSSSTLNIGGAAHELRAAMMNNVGQFALATAPDLADGSGLVVYWDRHRIGALEAQTAGGVAMWVGRTPLTLPEYDRLTNGSADGVRVALSIRRELPVPTATVSAVGDAVTEGGAATFEVTLNEAARAALTVAVEVTADGDVLSGAAPTSVTVASGSAAATLSVATDDDAVVEGDGSITVTLGTGDGYELGEATTAVVTVADDDEATWAVTAEPGEIAEGGLSTIRVSTHDGVTFAEDRTLTLSVTGDVLASDYALDAQTLDLVAGATSATTTIEALADEVDEETETARIAVLLDGSEVGEASLSIFPASTDATLTDLALSAVDIGAFDGGTTSYAGAAASGIEATVVEATPSDANAEVEIADASGSTLGTRRTSQLATGSNEIAATVTAEDRLTKRTYTVAVTRAPAWGARLPERDIALGGSGESTGVWSDGWTLWALPDWQESAARAYELATGLRRGSRDLRVLEGRSYAALWSDGSTLWAASNSGGVVHAYRLSDGSRLSDEDLTGLSAAGNDAPAGLWSDDGTLYVVDHSDGRVYAYALDGSRREEKEFGLRTGDVESGWPWGAWSDGEMLLTSWYGRGRLLAYRLSDRARLPAYDIDVGSSGNGNPRDLWSDGETLWVADGLGRKLYAYAVPGLRRAVVGSALSSRAAPVPSGDPGALVSIPDAALRGRIEVVLGKASGEALGTNELAALEVLAAAGAGVADLTGLEHAVNLTGLDLSGNPAQDLRSLAALSRLEALNLDGIVADPWSLAALGGLRRLSWRNGGLEESGWLSTLLRLEELDLGGNRVANLSSLAGLASLRRLDLRDNRVEDISALAGLSTLVDLDVGGNRIADFGPLDGLLGLNVTGRGEQRAQADD